jgi:uncharacterized radical SAM superfamily Fe-S cluster-containing enzyme
MGPMRVITKITIADAIKKMVEEKEGKMKGSRTNGLADIILDYVKYFKKKTKRNLEVTMILNSEKYTDLINKIYQYYNKQSQFSGDARLSPDCYMDADKAIDYFWEILLGTKLPEHLKFNL